MIMSEWISVKDKLPEYGVPVIIAENGVTQHVTYMLDGADDVSDWFEPYHFDHDDHEKVWCHKVSFWSRLPEYPKE